MTAVMRPLSRQDIVGAEIRPVHEVPGLPGQSSAQSISSSRACATDALTVSSITDFASDTHGDQQSRVWGITPCGVLTDSLRSEWAEPARLWNRTAIASMASATGCRTAERFGFRQVLQRDTHCARREMQWSGGSR